MVDGVRPREVEAAVRGARILDAGRRGKHLWLELDRRPWPLLHLGMTGSLRTPGEAPLRLATDPEPADDRWPPRHLKLHLTFDDGNELAFVDRRRLGRLRLREDPRTSPPVADLGFDPWLERPSRGAFRRAVRRRRATLKGLLLDQRFVAGLGNWLVDEILHLAGLSPRRRADRLEDGEIDALGDAIREIVRTAVEADADSSRFPPEWLFHRRWTGKGAEDPGDLRRERIAGRTTLWSPSRQK